MTWGEQQRYLLIIKITFKKSSKRQRIYSQTMKLPVLKTLHVESDIVNILWIKGLMKCTQQKFHESTSGEALGGEGVCFSGKEKEW